MNILEVKYFNNKKKLINFIFNDLIIYINSRFQKN